MGDRANIRIIEKRNATESGSIWIYSHWAGSDLPTMLQEALNTAKPRWGDNSYAIKIICDQVMKSSRDKETGWGISLRRGDNEYNIMEVDMDALTVSVRSRNGFDDETWESTGKVTKKPISFEAFCALPDAVKWRGEA